MSREGSLDTPYGDQNQENFSSRPPAPWQWDIFQTLGAASAIGAGTARPLMTLVYGGLANEFNNHQDENAGGLKKTVGSQALFLVYLFAGQLILTCLYGILLSISAMNYSRRLRAAYLKSVICQDVGRVSQGKAADNLATSINIIEDAFSEKLGIVMQAGSTVIVSLVIAFVKSWQLTLVLFSTIVALFISNFGTAALETKFEHQIQEIEEEAAVVAEEGLSGIRVIMAYVAESKLAEKYATFLRHTRGRRLRKSPILAVQFSISYFGLLAAYALAFWYGTILLNRGKIESGGTIVTVIFSINQGTNGMRKILPIYSLLSKARVASTTLNKVINSTPIIDPLSSSGVVLNELRGDIRLENVTYSYPMRPAIRVIDRLNINFAAGKTTALIGASGSGKSTIVGLLERWYDPFDGTVLIDGCNASSLNVKFLRSNIGLVQQEVTSTFFNDSIYYNVACGLFGTIFENIPEDDKRAMVVKSCIEVGAHSFIESLSSGYETKVGDKGNRLSGGQLQRLSIARAIISSPKILIFDEATSGLDVDSERIVEAAIKLASKGRTTIIIAHKLYFVQQCDQIILLKNGQVLEKGTHESLLALDGRYTRFCESQELNYGAITKAIDSLKLGERTENFESLNQAKIGLTNGDKEQPARIIPNDDISVARSVSDISISRCLLSIFGEHQSLKWLLIAIVPTCVVAAGVYPSQGILFGNSVSGFKHETDIQGHENFWSLMWLIVGIATSVVFFIMGTLSSIMGTLTKFYCQVEYLKSIIRQDPVFFDDEEHSAGILVASISLYTNEVQNLLTIFGSLLVSVVSIAYCSILALAIAWRLALVGLFGSVPVAVLAGYLRVNAGAAKAKSLSVPLLNSAQYASEVIGAARTVAALTMEEEVCRQLDKRMRESLPVFYKHILKTMPLFAFSESGPFLGMALVFWYGGTLLADGKLDSTGIWIVFLSVYASGENTGEFFANAGSISRATHAVKTILALRTREEVGKSPAEPQERHGRQEPAHSIEFRKVNFSYPNAPNRPVLQDISFTVEPGQKLAIVGPSGSGKSTIISLLEKFYRPNNGSIIIGGHPLDEIDTTPYRNTVSLVSQNTTLFHGTLRENILLGTTGGDSTDERLKAAAKDANIHDFIVSLPEGYNTPCGDKGIAFSGGQRQRLALARALVRKSKILLLDEATSALDSLSEIEVLDALGRVDKQTIMVTVAHRLATIRNADCILVLVEGRIVERGTHAQLMQRKGTYWAMSRAQALDRDL